MFLREKTAPHRRPVSLRRETCGRNRSVRSSPPFPTAPTPPWRRMRTAAITATPKTTDSFPAFCLDSRLKANCRRGSRFVPNRAGLFFCTGRDTVSRTVVSVLRSERMGKQDGKGGWRIPIIGENAAVFLTGTKSLSFSAIRAELLRSRRICCACFLLTKSVVIVTI